MNRRTCFEIVGPPGSGKTTIVSELVRSYPEFRPQSPPDWHAAGEWPFFLAAGLVLLPTFAALTFGPGGRRPRPEELFGLICLRRWHRRWRRRGIPEGPFVLDQGPVFMLAELAFFRERQILRMTRRASWRRTLARWRPIVGGIVWLDAPDPVLAARINARGKGHLIKGAPAAETFAFLRRSRASLSQAVSILKAGGPSPALMTLDTGSEPPAATVERLAAALRSDGVWDPPETEGAR